MHKRGRLLIVCSAFLSGASIALEIILTNLFGILFTSDMVPVIIGVAIFGIGMGAFLASEIGRRRSLEKVMETLGWVSAVNAVYISFLSLFLAAFPWLQAVPVYVLAVTVPFAMTGWCISALFQICNKHSVLLYASQLFGDTIGVLGAIVGMNLWGGLRAILFDSLVVGIVSIVLLLSAPLEGQWRMRTKRLQQVVAMALIGISLGVNYLVGQNILGWNLNYSQMNGASSDKTLITMLKSVQGAKIVYSVWDAFAKTDVVQVPGDQVRYVFQDGGAGSPIFRFNGQLASLKDLKNGIQYIPFALGSADPALIIGTGGGLDVLNSLLSGAKQITAVELNPGIVQSVLHYSSYDGNLFQRPGVRVVAGDGRNLIERSRNKYSIISLDMVLSAVSDTRDLSLTENYLFTNKAFEEYLNHLTAEGRIAVVSHNTVEGLRVFFTGIQALQEVTGKTPSELRRQMIFLSEPSGDMTLEIFSKQPFSSAQLEKVINSGGSMGLLPIYLPTVNERLLQPIIDGKVTLAELDHAVPGYAVDPVSDDKPFFYQTTPGLPASVWEWLATIFVLTVGLSWYVWARNVRNRKLGEPSFLNSRRIVYFSLLGIGYMAVQLPLIEKYLLVLWNPVLSMAVVISSMVVGGGVGSFIINRFRPTKGVIFLAMPVVILLQVIWLPRLLPWLLSTSLSMTVFVVAAVTFITGVALGLPFPIGLLEAETTKQSSSAVYYAVNGIASVWGTWMATVTSMLWGFQVTLIIATGIYVAVWVFRPRSGWVLQN